jgi:hypothetical protein
VPGGSSGGPAAAVACGFTSFELGTDIGGSIRIPSHCCGVFGLKPSFGVVPQRGYLDQVGGGITDADINVFGPIARSADDLDLLLGVLAGPEPERALAWRLTMPPPRHADIGSYRVGVWLEVPDSPVDRDELAVLRAAVDRLAAAGAKVEEAHPPVDFAKQVALFNTMIVAAISPSMEEDIRDAVSGSHHQWLQAERERARLRAVWAEWFETYDILLCPALAVPAFPHNQDGDFMSRTLTINGDAVPYLNAVQWTGLIGVLGLPSAVPSGSRLSRRICATETRCTWPGCSPPGPAATKRRRGSSRTGERQAPARARRAPPGRATGSPRGSRRACLLIGRFGWPPERIVPIPLLHCGRWKGGSSATGTNYSRSSVVRARPRSCVPSTGPTIASWH